MGLEDRVGWIMILSVATIIIYSFYVLDVVFDENPAKGMLYLFIPYMLVYNILVIYNYYLLKRREVHIREKQINNRIRDK